MMIENSKRAKSSQQAAGKKQMMMKKKEAEIHDDQKLWDQIYIICLGELSKLMIDMTCGMLWDSGAGNNSCNGGGGVFLSLIPILTILYHENAQARPFARAQTHSRFSLFILQRNVLFSSFQLVLFRWMFSCHC